MLEQQINQAFLEAYKSKNEESVATLRMIKSAIQNKKIEKGIAKEEQMSDDDMIALLKSESKKRQDSMETYRAAGREDLATKEEGEIAAIKKFLPEQMDEEAVRQLVASVIADQGNPGIAGFGKIMGAAVAKAKGAADGALVSKVVKEALAK